MKRTPPSYIEKYLSNFHTTDDGITWQGKLTSSSGGTQFNIAYFGDFYDGFIVANDESEELIVAIDTKSKERILLFDGCKHGYDNLFCEEYSDAQINERSTENVYADDTGNTVFEIEMRYFYNIDFEEESEDLENDNGEIELITGEIISLEQLMQDGFDAYAINGITPSGETVEIAQRELA